MCSTNINYNTDAIILGPLDVDNLHEIHSSDLDFQSRNTKEYYKQVEINGTTYRLSTFLVTDMQKSETEFGEIMKIFRHDNITYFYMKIYEQITFDNHCHAYTVKCKNIYKLFKYEDLPVIAPCLSVKVKNDHFIATRYVL